MRETRQVGELNLRDFKEGGIQFDPFLLIFDMGPNLIRTARAKRRKDGVSYRAFHVGASTISVNDDEQKASFFVGANYKPHPEVPKRCAEMNALTEAKRLKHRFTPGLFVAGTTDQELIRQVTGRETPTLHPCDPCRDLLQESTVVITVGDDKDVYEAHTGKDLWQLYRPPEHPQRRRDRKPAEVHNVIEDPGFATFAAAKAVYTQKVAEFVSAPEHSTRSMRADAVVASLYEVAG